MNFLKYTLWPALKVRLIYWWWIIKYHGKKNIPPEVLFGSMKKSMERMRENLMQAFRHMPDDLSDEEKKEFMDLLRTAGALEGELNNVKKEKRR